MTGCIHIEDKMCPMCGKEEEQQLELPYNDNDIKEEDKEDKEK